MIDSIGERMRDLNQQEYARYLLTLLGESPEGEEEIDVDSFYGYFQCYMPSGEGVERTFEPLEKSAEYLNRIKLIYEMLDPKDFEGDSVPGYFNGRTEEAPEEQITRHGRDLIERLLLLFKDQPEDELMEEAATYLSQVTKVVLLKKGKIRSYQEDEEEVLGEAIYELVNSHEDDEGPINILREAYYSIACDYYVSYYLQWPRYQGLENSDPFAPYFELYRLGYMIAFVDQTLYIGKE